ncbi:hypothetical protein CCICO_00265 [Corynebacterium ciconiae DSM 44920]|uniref:TSUP family transporter n=1 Tax=Corynebacterium ciconiae TaxID=227319 RepID=UPI000375E80E|nr:TSUP family transporter [Corynebacterium ciconiae]WKD60116.1 hypothetical protein CCICO_00265 [Corynebacterium ciconiae DSM 44920]
MFSLGLGGWLVLLGGAFAAGWIDAVIGGGGLVLIPVIMAVLPHASPVVALATNKFAACLGTGSAAVSLSRKVQVERRRLVTYIPIAAASSGAGALIASSLSKEVLRPIVIVMLVVVGVFVVCRPDFGEQARERSSRRREAVVLIAVGAIALYDGVFGPGTGTFLIMVFTAVLGRNFLQSAVLAKVVNCATNFGALVVFILGGHVWWTMGIALAVMNVAGAQLGARTVIAGGTKLIRIALLTLVVVMSCYLSYTQIFGEPF